jgi:hypothetical protein
LHYSIFNDLMAGYGETLKETHAKPFALSYLSLGGLVKG